MLFKYLISLKHSIENELSNILMLSPIFLGLGIAYFFSLPDDPSLSSCLIALIISIILVIISVKSFLLNRLCLLLLITCIGFIACQFRVLNIASPHINEPIVNKEIIGTITQVIDTPTARKLLLDDLTIQSLEAIDTPKFVRISTKSDVSSFAIGDKIALLATLMPPPHPSYPGGFNFAEYSYFKEIGAIGYAMSRPYKLLENNLNTLQKYINSIRKFIGNRIETAMQTNAASIALALLIGDTSKINKYDLNIVRISGIAHIIAISGLHVVITVGLIFFATRGCLSRFPIISINYDLKKIAAFTGIIGSFVYLIIAGSPISAQRAFIMSTITLIAILIDRVPSPLRSIAIAAIIILILTPENLFSASLQMSFAASLSLITCFNYLTNYFKSDISSFKRKAFIYFISTIISTLVAGSATAPFVVYHFNQFSSYSLLTNIIAVPLTNFYIMPLGVTGLLLMPLHLESLALIPMSWGINFMLYVADVISSLPQSSLYFSSYLPWGLGCITFGGLMICVMTTHLKWLGIPLLIIGLTTNTSFFQAPHPDILLESSGRLFAFNESGNYYFSSKAKARFTRNSWEQHFGIKNTLTIKNTPYCQHGYCTIINNNLNALVLNGSSQPPIASCDNSLIVNLSDQKIQCPITLVIDKNFLKANGNTFVWLTPNGVQIETVLNKLKRRIWNHYNF